MRIRRNSIKIVKGFFIFLLFALSIVAMVFGSINIGKNNTQKGLFGDNYFMSYRIDLSGKKDNEKKSTMKQVSEAYSNWLISKNINVNSVQHSFEDGKNFGDLYVQRQNVDKIKDNDEDKNQNPFLVAINSISSSRITIQQYNPEAPPQNEIPTILNPYNKNEQFTSVLENEDLNFKKAKKDSRDKLATNSLADNFGVNVELTDKSKPLNIKKFIEQKENQPDETKKLEWIVFQDLDLLVAKLNYAKKVAWEKEYLNNTEEMIFNFKTLPSNLQVWAKEAVKGRNSDLVSKNNILFLYENSSGGDTGEGDASRIINLPPNANSNLRAVVDEHIIGRIDYNNYNDWFPESKVIGDNNDSGDGGDSGDQPSDPPPSSFLKENVSFNNGILKDTNNSKEEIVTLSFQNSTSESTRTDLIKKFTEMNFSAPLAFDFTDKQTGTGIPGVKDYKSPFTGLILGSHLSKNIFNLDAYESTMLSLGVSILMIGIIVSVLYRIPGLFGGFAITASAVFSAALLVVLKINFSISTFTGLIAAIVSSTLSVVIFMERVRKLIKDRHSVFDATQTAFKKSLLSVIDVHLIVLLFGLGSVFIGKGEIVDFGLVLIVVSVIGIASMFIYFVLPLYLIIDFRKLWKTRLHVYLNAKSKNGITFERVEKFNKNYLKFIIPIISIATVILLIVGSSMIGTLGIKNSSYYNDGSTLYLNMLELGNLSNKTEWEILDILKSNNSNWKFLWSFSTKENETLDGQKVKLFAFQIAQNIDKNSIVELLSKYVKGANVSSAIGLTNVAPSYAISLSKSGINSILVGYGFISIYAIFRLNFFSIFAVFIASAIGMIIPTAMIYIFWLPINSEFIYAMLFVSMIASMVAFSYISITKTRFNKRQIAERNELINFVSFNMYHIKNTIIIAISLILLCNVIFFITGSQSMYLLFIYIIILSIFAALFTYLLIPILYYVTLVIRQKYVKNIFATIDSKIHTGIVEVDEELIEGINKK